MKKVIVMSILIAGLLFGNNTKMENAQAKLQEIKSQTQGIFQDYVSDTAKLEKLKKLSTELLTLVKNYKERGINLSQSILNQIKELNQKIENYADNIDVYNKPSIIQGKLILLKTDIINNVYQTYDYVEKLNTYNNYKNYYNKKDQYAQAAKSILKEQYQKEEDKRNRSNNKFQTFQEKFQNQMQKSEMQNYYPEVPNTSSVQQIPEQPQPNYNYQGSSVYLP